MRDSTCPLECNPELGFAFSFDRRVRNEKRGKPVKQIHVVSRDGKHSILLAETEIELYRALGEAVTFFSLNVNASTSSKDCLVHFIPKPHSVYANVRGRLSESEWKVPFCFSVFLLSLIHCAARLDINLCVTTSQSILSRSTFTMFRRSLHRHFEKQNFEGTHGAMARRFPPARTSRGQIIGSNRSLRQ